MPPDGLVRRRLEAFSAEMSTPAQPASVSHPPDAYTTSAQMLFKPRFSAIPRIFLPPAEGCGCLAGGLRSDCSQFGCVAKAGNWYYCIIIIIIIIHHQVYLLNNKYKRAVTVNTMLNRNDNAKALTVTPNVNK